MNQRSGADRLVLWVAEGFGLGRMPVAPGTFGTAAGFAWLWVLLLAGNVWVYFAGLAAGFFGAVWIGDRAEVILDRKDPGSVVVDEIAALPLVFAGPVVLLAEGARTPGFEHYLAREHWAVLLLGFGLFRLFDILKPLGIRQVQEIHGGWGLVIDDFLAAGLAWAGVLGYWMVFK